MEKASTTITTTQQQKYSSEKTINFDDVPTELVHLIQSLLPEEEAARTCVLSKSWLHAWSTIPDLRFPGHESSKPQETIFNNLVFRTVQRYHDNGLPIQTLDLQFHVRHPGYTEFWFRHVLSSQTRSCLKELSLEIYNLTGSMFTFPEDILFSGEKLEEIRLKRTKSRLVISPGINPDVIKCVSLRILELDGVDISEDVLDNLLSTCSLLELIILELCRGLKTIKVKNLGCLRRLVITSLKGDGLLEIDNVPSLDYFYYKVWIQKNLIPFKTTETIGRSVTWLVLKNMIIDDTFFDMIKSKFPVLETLILEIAGWASERMVITSLSLKSLTLYMNSGQRLIDLQVYAPYLLSFDYFDGTTLPTTLFPAIAPKEINLELTLRNPLDTSFFLRLRELLNLSSKFDIRINLLQSAGHKSPFPFNADDVDDLRKRALFPPVTNVQQLSLGIRLEDGFTEHTRVFDAFFSICHPIHVNVQQYLRRNQDKSFPKLTLRWLKENNKTDLEDVLMKNPVSGRWEAPTDDFLDSLPDNTIHVEFKLMWFNFLDHD